jgi:hypothetical protein
MVAFNPTMVRTRLFFNFQRVRDMQTNCRASFFRLERYLNTTYTKDVTNIPPIHGISPGEAERSYVSCKAVRVAV